MIKELFVSDIERMISFQQQENFSDGYNKGQFESSFSSGNFLALGYFIEKDLQAFITLSIATDSADIEDLLVAKIIRRQGIGAKLLREVEERLKNKGIKNVFLEVREGNTPAKSLYEKCGYSEISVRKKYYFDGENALVLRKEL